ncbi:helix-turn-helix transcriptional regulator [Kribbella sp. NPDC003505]|uniref:helix-turn-helix domain-containing protein n=1 Tax=Kribbella sp. NPDC003505 TaxID=3154448 RepID=UPI0033A40A01
MAAKMASRRCASCGAVLARDNTASLCSPCRRVRQAAAPAPPEMPAEFWQSPEIHEAASRRDMGALLYAYRSHPTHGHRPLPQTVLSNWLGITQSQLSRLESGRNRVRELDKLEHYARVLGIPADVLWFDMPSGTPKRPLRANVSATLPSDLRLPAHLVSAGPSVSDSLLLTLQQYAATDNLAGSRSLVPVVPHQVKFIEDLVGKSRGQGQTQLLYVAARFAEFAGWANQDAGDLREAMRWSNIALDYAQEAEDSHLTSYIQMRKSSIASDANKPKLALGFAKEALQNGSALSPQVRAVAYRQAAQAHAISGDATGCARMLQQAYELANQPVEDENDIARYCTPSYIEMEAANCWVELEKPKEAIKTLHQGLKVWQPEFRRDLGLCLSRLAVAYAISEEPDNAVAVAQQSLSIAANTRSQRIVGQLARVPGLLTTIGAGDQAKQLQRQLATL